MAISCITFSRFQFNNLIYQVVSYVGNFFSSQLQITIILYLFYVYWYYLIIAQVNIIHLMNYDTLINNDYTCMLSQKCSQLKQYHYVTIYFYTKVHVLLNQYTNLLKHINISQHWTIELPGQYIWDLKISTVFTLRILSRCVFSIYKIKTIQQLVGIDCFESKLTCITNYLNLYNTNVYFHLRKGT